MVGIQEPGASSSFSVNHAFYITIVEAETIFCGSMAHFTSPSRNFLIGNTFLLAPPPPSCLSVINPYSVASFLLYYFRLNRDASPFTSHGNEVCVNLARISSGLLIRCRHCVKRFDDTKDKFPWLGSM